MRDVEPSTACGLGVKAGSQGEEEATLAALPQARGQSGPLTGVSRSAAAQAEKCALPLVGKKIWIDLDNSPHVPFFAPIIEELERRGFSVLVTARDCFQVCGLAELLRLRHHRVGRHYGKNPALKLLGLGIRAIQMMPAALRARPTLALSHGSRSQLITSRLLGIPTVIIGDYEFSKIFAVVRPECLIVPQVIPDEALQSFAVPLLKYPGIKEDVYAHRFRPDPALARELGLDPGKLLVVTIRPPATEAHYHVPDSDRLFEAVLDFLGKHPEVKIVLVPRNQSQALQIRALKPHLFASGQAIVPDRVVDGLNLIWYSDLVISGGGTMNREAAALGVPVYSIFRGKIGAVDRYLATQGRLTLIESPEQVPTKLLLRPRERPSSPSLSGQGALEAIVAHVIKFVEQTC
jgi:predicted glycosyltransferase